MESFLNRVFACCLYVSRSAWRSLSSPSARGKPSATRASIVSFTIPAPCALANAARMAKFNRGFQPRRSEKNSNSDVFLLRPPLARARAHVRRDGRHVSGRTQPVPPNGRYRVRRRRVRGLTPDLRPSSHARPRGYRRRRAGRLEKHRCEASPDRGGGRPSKPALAFAAGGATGLASVGAMFAGGAGPTTTSPETTPFASDPNENDPKKRKLKKTSLGLSAAYYQQFFGADTDDVLRRARHALLTPWHGGFQSVYDDTPDLYGPFWVCATLVFVIAMEDNTRSYLSGDAAKRASWNFDARAAAASAVRDVRLRVFGAGARVLGAEVRGER